MTNTRVDPLYGRHFLRDLIGLSLMSAILASMVYSGIVPAWGFIFWGVLLCLVFSGYLTLIDLVNWRGWFR